MQELTENTLVTIIYHTTCTLTTFYQRTSVVTTLFSTVHE